MIISNAMCQWTSISIPKSRCELSKVRTFTDVVIVKHTHMEVNDCAAVFDGVDSTYTIRDTERSIDCYIPHVHGIGPR